MQTASHRAVLISLIGLPQPINNWGRVFGGAVGGMRSGVSCAAPRWQAQANLYVNSLYLHGCILKARQDFVLFNYAINLSLIRMQRNPQMNAPRLWLALKGGRGWCSALHFAFALGKSHTPLPPRLAAYQQLWLWHKCIFWFWHALFAFVALEKPFQITHTLSHTHTHTHGVAHTTFQ